MSSLARSPRFLRGAALVLLGLFSIVFAFDEVTLAGNDATRFAVIQAVGEQQVFHIENTAFRSVDVVRANGHVFSDKPLPLAWSAGMIHRAVHFLTGWNFTDNYFLLVWLYNVLIGFTVNVLLFWWIFNAFRRVRRGTLVLKWVLALGLVFSTWLLSYSVLLNNHTPAALTILGCYILLEKFRRAPSVKTAFPAGIAAGGTVCFDLPIGGLCCAASVLAIGAMDKKLSRAAIAAAGALIMLAAYELLNFHAYNTWLPLYIAGTTGTYQVPQAPGIGYWIEALAGYRGFFLYQPFLFLGLWFSKRESIPDRAMLLLALAGIVVYLVITEEFGGWAYGFRYLIPLIPILYYRAGRMVLLKASPRFRSLAAVLLLWGIVTSAVGAYVPFCVSYERGRSVQDHFTVFVRSSFLGNLMCASFEYAPDSPLTQALIRHYGDRIAMKFLYESACNMKKTELIQKVMNRKGPRP